MNIFPISKARINKVNDYELFLIDTINKAIEEKSMEKLSEYSVSIPLSIFKDGEDNAIIANKVLHAYENEGYTIDKNNNFPISFNLKISW